MPTKKKPAREVTRDLPAIPKELIDQFVNGPMAAEAIQDASMAFKKTLIERALGAELGHHLGYPQGAERPEESSNQRNGKSSKTVLTDDGPLRLEIPRDREGSFGTREKGTPISRSRVKANGCPLFWSTFLLFSAKNRYSPPYSLLIIIREMNPMSRR